MAKVFAVIGATRYHSPGLGYWDNDTLAYCFGEEEEAKDKMVHLNRASYGEGSTKYRVDEVDVPEGMKAEEFITYLLGDGY